MLKPDDQINPLLTKINHFPTAETGSPSSTLVEQWSQQRAQVLYSPTLEQQTSSSPKGLDADFVIEYDVILTDLIGDVQVMRKAVRHLF